MNDNYYNRKNRGNNSIGDEYSKMGMMHGFNNSARHYPGTGSHHQQSAMPPNVMPPQLVNILPPMGTSQPMPNSQYNMGCNAPPYLQNAMYSYPGHLNIQPGAAQNYTSGMRYHQMNNSIPGQNYNKEMKQISGDNKLKHDNHFIHKPLSYPVRLLVNTELVGPLIGRKGEKIKEITTNTGAKIDIKRENVPYNQFGLNQYMFSGCGGARNASDFMGDGESQIVFITGETARCSSAVEEIMKICSQTANEQGRPEPALGLLAEDRFCARLIGKEGRNLNVVRMQAGCQIHVSNVPTITTLSQSPHVISLDRIINCKGTLAGLLEAEKMISEKIKNCVTEDAASGIGGSAHLNTVLSPGNKHRNETQNATQTSNQQQPAAPSSNATSSTNAQHNRPNSLGTNTKNTTNFQQNNMSTNIGSGIVHKANPNWPENLKLDENLYVRIPQACAGSIIGSEGKAVRRIMNETGTYIQVSKTNLSALETIPAVHTYKKQPIPTDYSEQLSIINKDGSEATPNVDSKLSNHRLLTIKGNAQCQSSALAHIFQRVRMCYNSQNIVGPAGDGSVRLWVILRIPKTMLGRLIGKDGKVIRHLQASTKTFLSFPKIVGEENGDKNKSDESNSTETKEKTDKKVDKKKDDKKSEDSKKEGEKLDKDGKENNTNNNLTNPDEAIFGDDDLHVVEVLGSYECVEAAVFSIRQVIYSSIYSQYGPALIPGPHGNSGPSPSATPYYPSGPPPNMTPSYHPHHQQYMAAMAAYASANSQGHPGQHTTKRYMYQQPSHMHHGPPPHHHNSAPPVSNAWIRSFNSNRKHNNLYHQYHMQHQYQKVYRRARRLHQNGHVVLTKKKIKPGTNTVPNNSKTKKTKKTKKESDSKLAPIGTKNEEDEASDNDKEQEQSTKREENSELYTSTMSTFNKTSSTIDQSFRTAMSNPSPKSNLDNKSFNWSSTPK